MNLTIVQMVEFAPGREIVKTSCDFIMLQTAPLVGTVCAVGTRQDL